MSALPPIADINKCRLHVRYVPIADLVEGAELTSLLINSCARRMIMADYRKTPEAISRLSSERYRVTQQSGTEAPGTGEYLDNKEPGIHVDIVSGEPLFALSDRSKSGCGWPSFTKPIEPANVNEFGSPPME